MESKLDKLSNIYINNKKFFSEKEDDWILEDYFTYPFEDYVINLILNKNEIREVVISIEKNNKLIFCTNGIEIELEKYNILKNDIIRFGFDNFINNNYELLKDNIM